jgi:hypothetical protein
MYNDFIERNGNMLAKIIMAKEVQGSGLSPIWPVMQIVLQLPHIKSD